MNTLQIILLIVSTYLGMRQLAMFFILAGVVAHEGSVKPDWTWWFHFLTTWAVIVAFVLSLTGVHV